MPDYTTVGTDITIEWGVKDLTNTAPATKGFGEIISVRDRETGEVRDIKDGNGNTFIKVLFDARREFEVEAIIDTDATLPDRGELATINGIGEAIIEDIEQGFQGGEEGTVTFTLKQHDAITVS